MRSWVPKVIAAVIFLAGVINIASSFWARSLARILLLEPLIPLELAHASRTAATLAGLGLIILARGIWQQKQTAWWLSVGLLWLSVLLHLTKGFDFEEALILIIPLGLLLKYKNIFYVKSGGQKTLSGIKNLGLILIVLFAYAVLGFFAFNGQFGQPVTWRAIYEDYIFSIFGVGQNSLIPITRRAMWFDNSLSVVGIAAILSALAALFAPFLEKRRLNDEEADLVQRLVANYSAQSTDYLTLMPDKEYYIAQNKQAFLAYKVSNNTAVVLGGPVGEPSARAGCLKEFQANLAGRGLGLAIANVSEPQRFGQFGFSRFKIGEEAIVIPAKFDVNTPALKDIRNAVSKIGRDGILFRWYRFSDIPWEVMTAVNELHENWLESRHGPELTFSVDFFPPSPTDEAYFLTAFAPGGKLVGAFSFLPYRYDKAPAFALELMLRSGGAPNGLAEAMIAAAIEFFRNQGAGRISLGVAPLFNSGGPVRTLFNRFNYFYGFKSLSSFKKKFNPLWEPAYLLYQGRMGLAKALLAVVQVHLKNKDWWKRLIKPLRLLWLAVALAAVIGTLFLWRRWDSVWVDLQHTYYQNQNRLAPAVTDQKSQGRVETISLNSGVLKVTKQIKVYLPGSYTENSDKRFPVLYLLHGFPGSNSDWLINADLKNQLDQMIDSGEIQPLIVVFPDANGPVIRDGQYLNATVINQPMEDYLLEVVQTIDGRYHTRADRLDRGIGGLSSGAYGAMNVGLKHNDIFGLVLALSGYFRNKEAAVKKLLDGNQAAISANSPLDYINSVNLNRRTYIYMSIGERDSREYLTENREMAAILTHKQIPNQLIVTAGRHDWKTWRRDIAAGLKLFGGNLY